MFKKVDKKDYEYILSISSKSRVFFGDEIEHDYTHDEMGTIKGVPEIHVKAISKEEVSKIMKYAYENNISVTVRGAGTGLVGACVPVCGGILLDLSKMNKILELDKTNLTLTVEPGVLLLDIYEKAEKEGLFYAPDPGEKTATIGGNISCNAGGMRAVKYGVTRDWVRALEVVLPNGEITTFGGKVVKNSSGYALKDLIIGSEGTLAVVVEATLKLIPKPKKSISLLVPFENKEVAIGAVPKLMVEHVIPTGVEFFEKTVIANSQDFLGKKIPNNNYDAYLLLTYDGSNDVALEDEIETASKLCVEKYGALDVYLVDTEERKSNIWTVRGAFLEAIKASTSEMDECDVVLPRAKILDFLNYTSVVSREVGVRIPYFGHIGDGNLHIYLCKDDIKDSKWEDIKTKGFELLYNKAHEMGGLVSGEHGIGFAKREYLFETVGNIQMNLMREIKKAFDPKGILNPKKVV